MGPDRDESGLGVHFAVTRSMRDTASLLDAVCGPGIGDNVVAPTPLRAYSHEVGADPGRLRIGLLARHPLGGHLDPECATAARHGAALLETLGHDVSEAHPGVMEDATFSNRFMAIWATNMSLGIKTMGGMIGRDLTADDVEPVNWAMSEFAKHTSATDHAAALGATNEYRRAMQSWWAAGWDLLVTPTLAEPPVRVGEHDPTPDDPMAGMKRAAEFVSFTPPFNTSGQPAISLPLHVTADGRPVGVQLVAAYGREDLLIRVASQIEAADALLLPQG
jgi:amidase